MGLDETGSNDFNRIIWGLNNADKQVVKKCLEPYLSAENKKGELAREIYREIFGRVEVVDGTDK